MTVREQSSETDANETRGDPRRLWESAAPWWQRRRPWLWDASRHVGEWMVAKVGPRPGQTLLELAAGPGDTGFLAAPALGPGGRLITSDFSPQMVEVARRRALELGLTNVTFMVLDAQSMDLSTASVDGVLCRWGFMFMPDSPAAFAETRRVLKPGGRLAFSIWGPPETNPWPTILPNVLVAQGKMKPVDHWAPGDVFSLSNPRRIEDLVVGAGFAPPEIEEALVHFRYADVDEYWRFHIGTHRLMQGRSEQAIAEIRGGVREALEPFSADGRLDIPASVFNVATG